MHYGYNFNSDNLAQRIDENTPGITYIGFTAQNGNNTGSPIRYIKRIEESGNDTIILRAGGRLDFNQIRDDRASLSYS